MEFTRKGLYLLMVFIVLLRGGDAQLRENFYGARCPAVEQIVRQAVMTKISQTFTTIPATLRLFFHDCFVEGCDASVMIASPNNDAEKYSPDNLSLAGDGFDTVVKAKTAVEAACPGVVSCADILALAARDVVALSGGPSFNVELGRLDGFISQASRVDGNLPKPDDDLDKLNAIFSKNNLNQIDMIALSGAHTVGFSHCKHVAKRIYSFTPSSPIDPSLDPDYAQQLIGSCPRDVDPVIAIDMDPVTARNFDNQYYKNLVAGKGLFTSDQVLFTDIASRSTVNDFATNPLNFNGAFANGMINLGRVGVKSGRQGEIRKDCTAFNS